jgi:subtilisin family serine protease
MRKPFLSFLTLALIGLVLLPEAGKGQKEGSMDSRSDAAWVPGEMLVQLKAGAGSVDKSRALARINGEEMEMVMSEDRTNDGQGPLVLVKYQPDIPLAAAMSRLREDPNVMWAEPNYIYTHQQVSNDPGFPQLYGMQGPSTSPANQFGSNAAAAWAAGFIGSENVYVGVIDEGIQPTHPDLADQIWTNPFEIPNNNRDDDGNGYVDDVNGYNFADNNNMIYGGGPSGNGDDHGTHVAGTIGAIGGNGVGVAGVNWRVTIISGKFLGRSGGTTANAVRAIDYFTDLKLRHGLNIVATNNSWGGGGFSQALRDAIERANQAGILFIAAAGNGGADGVGDNNDNTPNYPSNYTNANVIAVAAITSTGAKSSFSNFGATTVDIGAPGSGIISTTAFNVYSNFSGTSMATPHVTGAAALYASVNPGASAAQIKNAILSSAVPTASLAGRTVTGGRLNVFAALSR